MRPVSNTPIKVNDFGVREGRLRGHADWIPATVNRVDAPVQVLLTVYTPESAHRHSSDQTANQESGLIGISRE